MTDSDFIPQKLKDLPHWIAWRLEERDGEKTKLPYDAKTGHFARSNDSSTWSDFKTAFDAADVLSDKGYDGLGFMLQGTNLVGLDFDSVIEGSMPEPFVLNILELLGNPYSEITPSGKGVRCFVECDTLPDGKRKFSGGHYGAEIYIGTEGGRYLTITGNRLNGQGIPKLAFEQMEIPYFLLSQMKNLRFKKQWTGDASEYDDDDSRLDLALLNNLSRLLQTKDRATLERYFNTSVPGHREKWVNREDYRNRTFEALKLGEKSTKEIRLALRFSRPPVAVTDSMAHDHVIGPLPGGRAIEGWFPLGSPSLVGGSSGTGKSTLMLDLLMSQAERLPVFGHETFGRSYMILMFDRGRLAHIRTMERMNYHTRQIPIQFMTSVIDNEASQEVINQIEKYFDRNRAYPQVVFIEGMDMLVRDANKKEVVMPFINELQQIAEHFHVAIIGSTGAPKSKVKEGYTAKRDQIFGSEAWSRLSETVVVMQYPEEKDTSDQRSMTVMLRNSKPEQFTLQFEHGHLIQAPEARVDAEEETPAVLKTVGFIENVLQDGAQTYARVRSAVKMEGVSDSNFTRAVAYLRRKKILLAKPLGKAGNWIYELAPCRAVEDDAQDDTVDSEIQETLPIGGNDVEPY